MLRLVACHRTTVPRHRRDVTHATPDLHLSQTSLKVRLEAALNSKVSGAFLAAELSFDVTGIVSTIATAARSSTVRRLRQLIQYLDTGIVDVESVRLCALGMTLGVLEERAAVGEVTERLALGAVVADRHRAPLHVLLETRLEQERVAATRALVRAPARAVHRCDGLVRGILAFKYLGTDEHVFQ